MINNIITNYNILKKNIFYSKVKLNVKRVKLLIASKYFSEQTLEEFIIKTNHRLFGENIIQQAAPKWKKLKSKYPSIKLHFLGKLQSNKIKNAIQLFNTIETIDSIKTAIKVKNISNQKIFLVNFV